MGSEDVNEAVSRERAAVTSITGGEQPQIQNKGRGLSREEVGSAIVSCQHDWSWGLQTERYFWECLPVRLAFEWVDSGRQVAFLMGVLI